MLVASHLTKSYAGVRALTDALCPPCGVEREVYLNTVHFSR